MANGTQFGSERTPLTACDVCEAMCLDAVDGTLSATERAAFELHVGTCAVCAEQWAEAQRGAAWMEILKAHRPEPSSALLAGILARTSGADASLPRFTGARAPAATEAVPYLVPLPAPMPLPSIVAAPAVANGRKVLQFGRRVTRNIGREFARSVPFGGAQMQTQPRLLMTAAMAFFSIALTLNMTGTKLSDLRPGAIHRTVADARANAARSFQSLRVVNQVESKVSELQQAEPQEGRNAPNSRDKDIPARNETLPAPSDLPRRDPQSPNGSSELKLAPAKNFHAASVRSSEMQPRGVWSEQATTQQKGA